MGNWVTSDTHFRHHRILEYCPKTRGHFKDIHEHDEFIITDWNSKVKPGDTVYHLGDFAFGRCKDVVELLKRLHGRIVFVGGNHDGALFEYGRKNNVRTPMIKNVVIDGKLYVLCHWPMRTWHKSHRGSWHLYGHHHNTLPEDPKSMSFDVGVDTHGMTLWNFDEIRVKMETKQKALQASIT